MNNATSWDVRWAIGGDLQQDFSEALTHPDHTVESLQESLTSKEEDLEEARMERDTRGVTELSARIYCLKLELDRRMS